MVLGHVWRCSSSTTSHEWKTGYTLIPLWHVPGSWTALCRRYRPKPLMRVVIQPSSCSFRHSNHPEDFSRPFQLGTCRVGTGTTALLLVITRCSAWHWSSPTPYSMPCVKLLSRKAAAAVQRGRTRKVLKLAFIPAWGTARL